MVVAGLVYLGGFVGRGWVAFDEGQLGQSALYVLNGALPHVGYQESYTGGLAFLYAWLFALTGIELLHIRWLLFAGAAWCLTLVYVICRRYLPPLGAALATWVALVWSFPNYLSGLPSWWLLICAVTSLWAIICHGETGRWSFLAMAGLSAGVAFALKQTGAYLIMAVVLAVAFNGTVAHPAMGAWVARLLGCAALVFPMLLVWARLNAAEGLYLVLPIAALAAVMWFHGVRRAAATPTLFRDALAVLVPATLPVIALLAPYAATGTLGSFFDGAFVQPFARVSNASYRMPSVIPALMIGLPVYAVALASRDAAARLHRLVFWPLIVGLAAIVPLDLRPYHAVWQSVRSLTLILPLYFVARVAITRTAHTPQHATIFASLTVLAFTSLNQYPFAVPVYFAYTAPLLIIGAVVCLVSWGVSPRLLAPWGVMLTLVGVVSLNRGFLYALGRAHDPITVDTPLALPRAHLTLLQEHAVGYQAIVGAIQAHIGNGRLVAGPDCPEMFFLTRRFNASGVMYEFMVPQGSPGRAIYEFDAWRNASVIVINHSPDFSPPLAPSLVDRLRLEFSRSTTVLQFEVRWR